MKNSQSFRTHSRSAHFIILVFIFCFIFFLPVQKHAELFKGTLPISSDICQNRSGFVAYVFDDLRFQ